MTAAGPRGDIKHVQGISHCTGIPRLCFPRQSIGLAVVRRIQDLAMFLSYNTNVSPHFEAQTGLRVLISHSLREYRNMFNQWKASFVATAAKLAQLFRAQAAPGPAEAEARQNPNLDWAVLVIGLCFTSAIEIALEGVQAGVRLPLIFHLLSLAIMAAFASLFVAKHMYEVPRCWAGAGASWGGVCCHGFFLAISVSFPLCLKLASWAIYAISLLVILICNYF
ncbi:hypothetical protein NMG60_11023973 [Bertholletia excelsa]